MRSNRIVLDLPATPQRDNFGLWAEQLSGIVWPSLVDEADRPQFSVKLFVSLYGSAQLSRTILSHAHRGVRRVEDVSRTGLTQVMFKLFLEGSERLRLDGRETSAQPGDLRVLDWAQPFEQVMTASTSIGLAVPRQLLPPRLRDRDLHGKVARPGTAATDLLTECLRAFDAAAEAGLTVAEGTAATHALLGLAEAVFGPAAQTRPRALDVHEQALRARACAYIEEHISDPGLSPADLVRALVTSRSTVYRLFESAGGVAAYVRERRLLRSREVIALDLSPELSLAEIATRQGFASEAQFGRSFKMRFGISPGAARKMAQSRRRRGEPLSMQAQTPGMPAQSWQVADL